MRNARAALLAALFVVLLVPASTEAAQIVFGQTASAIQPPLECELEEPADEIQLSVESGAPYTAPTAGVITSWSTFAHQGAAQSLALKVFARTSGLLNYQVLARDSRALTPGVLNTFPVAIPVKGGDRIGLAVPGEGAESPCAFETGVPGSSNDRILYREGDVAPGNPISFSFGESGVRLNVSATLLPPPTIAAIAPAAGSVKGGATTIAGANFASVSAVSFGGVASPGFTVDSEGQITATVPPGPILGPVQVTVTTIAGSASTSFTYEGCKVPKLRGKRLKGSRKATNRADCKLGKVTKRKGATAKTGKVVAQSPKPGTILAPDAKVRVTLKP